MSSTLQTPPAACLPPPSRGSNLPEMPSRTVLPHTNDAIASLKPPAVNAAGPVVKSNEPIVGGDDEAEYSKYGRHSESSAGVSRF
jgi:hypothetical protein